MNGICGHIPGTTCSNCSPVTGDRWAPPASDLDRIASALEKLVDAYTRAQHRDHYALTSDRYAANEAKQQKAEPDPLDENDHRDRLDRDGDIVRRKGHERWAWPGQLGFDSETAGWPLSNINATDGPLTFAPDAAPDALHADLTAPETERVPKDAAPAAPEPQEPPMCPGCGHWIDYHTRYVRCEIVKCPCHLKPSDIARTLIEQATGADEDVRLPDGWKLIDGHDVHRVGSSPGEREGLVVRDHRSWYAMSAASGKWRVCVTKQDAASWVIEQAGERAK